MPIAARIFCKGERGTSCYYQGGINVQSGNMPDSLVYAGLQPCIHLGPLPAHRRQQHIGRKELYLQSSDSVCKPERNHYFALFLAASITALSGKPHCKLVFRRRHSLRHNTSPPLHLPTLFPLFPRASERTFPLILSSDRNVSMLINTKSKSHFLP